MQLHLVNKSSTLSVIINFYSCNSPNNNFFSNYRIYSINRPGCLLNFWTLRVGAYSRWALIKFSPFSRSVTCLFYNKTVNGNNKMRRSNKARFPQNTLKKTPSSGNSVISTYSFLGGGRCKGVGAYFSLSGRGVG